jgi:hypothetical protein
MKIELFWVGISYLKPVYPVDGGFCTEARGRSFSGLLKFKTAKKLLLLASYPMKTNL